MAEALPLVRFRLKKLLPFDADDDAMVSYQVMSERRSAMNASSCLRLRCRSAVLAKSMSR